MSASSGARPTMTPEELEVWKRRVRDGTLFDSEQRPNPLEDTTCAHCGTVFPRRAVRNRINAQLGRRSYCSTDCSAASWRDQRRLERANRTGRN
jgi:hypothetical protein